MITINNSLALLYDHIEEKEVIESIEILVFNCKMFDYNIKFFHRGLSFFTIEIVTPNREHLVTLDIEVNARKKYLVKIDLTHHYDKEKYWHNKKDFHTSGITYDFMVPLKKALEIINNC